MKVEQQLVDKSNFYYYQTYLMWGYSKSKCEIENNTPCVYAIGFKRTTMLAYIYHGHSMAYDPFCVWGNLINDDQQEVKYNNE